MPAKAVPWKDAMPSLLEMLLLTLIMKKHPKDPKWEIFGSPNYEGREGQGKMGESLLLKETKRMDDQRYTWSWTGVWVMCVWYVWVCGVLCV